MKKQISSRLRTYGSTMVIGAIFFIYIFFQWVPAQSNELHIVMLNIGQGDALYIRTPGGKDIIIDGGPDRSVIAEIGSVMPPYDHTIEWMVATHPDADHIAGLSELQGAYRVERLLWNGYEKETAFSDALLQAAAQNQTEMIRPQRGDRMEIEADVWLEFLHPVPKEPHEDVNDDSIVFVLHHQDATALFTGDASQAIEEELVEQFGNRLDVDLLKASHHGSKTGTGEALLHATTPEIALISVGVDNRFGHPHAGPLFRLQQFGVNIFRTDKDGRVLCTSTGDHFQCL